MTNEEIKKVLDNVRVGDGLKTNCWDEIMSVRGVSEHFIVARHDPTDTYTVIWKELNPYGYNGVPRDCYVCGPDDFVFWSPLIVENHDLYDFKDMATTAKYLETFEKGEAHISMRRWAQIKDIEIV